MQQSKISNLRRISPQDGPQYFFGYYDVPAFSQNDQLHLAHRMQFWDRLPNEDDVAEVGFMERGKSTFTSIRIYQKSCKLLSSNLIQNRNMARILSPNSVTAKKFFSPNFICTP